MARILPVIGDTGQLAQGRSGQPSIMMGYEPRIIVQFPAISGTPLFLSLYLTGKLNIYPGAKYTAGRQIFYAMTNRLVRITLFSALGIVIAMLFAWQYGFLSPGGSRPGASGIAKIGGPFTLTDHTGTVRTELDFRGKLTLIYFGYTYCPDVCPTALQIMSVALQNLGGQADSVTPVFITIDPERDTAKHLSDYVKNFHARMVGLTGSAEQIKQAAKVYRVYYRKAQPASGAPDQEYLMDHSSVVYLMDRDGRYITHFTHQSQSEDIEAAIRKYL